MQKSRYSFTQKSLIFVINALVWISLDQWTKVWAVAELKGQQTRYYLSGFFQLVYAENNGAWGNLGGSWQEPWRTLFLIVIPVAVLLGISIAAIINKKASKLETWSYILISCGGMGNIIDRIRVGYVVDFLYAGIGRFPFQTNIFNIADVVIMTGFGLMIIQIFRDRPGKGSSS